MVVRVLVNHRKLERNKKEECMLIGAGIAGLLIVSLFFEMVSSSPKASEESTAKLDSVK
jgi:hypothetical protein